MINKKQELCCTHLLCPSVMQYIYCLSCIMFFSCPYMVTVVLSITLAAEDVTALVSVNKQFKKIHQIIGYNKDNKVFHFISLIFPWTKVAVVGGNGPCDCMCMHCGQSYRAFLLTLQFKFHHGGITRNTCLTTKSSLSLLLICLEICQPIHIGMVQCK